MSPGSCCAASLELSPAGPGNRKRPPYPTRHVARAEIHHNCSHPTGGDCTAGHLSPASSALEPALKPTSPLSTRCWNKSSMGGPTEGPGSGQPGLPLHAGVFQSLACEPSESHTSLASARPVKADAQWSAGSSCPNASLGNQGDWGHPTGCPSLGTPQTQTGPQAPAFRKLLLQFKTD